MVNRERFMLDVDSEGFPLQDTAMASYNLTTPRVHSAVSAALLADTKCLRCANPLGWQEIDGVVLPRITWAERVGNCSDPRCVLYGTEKCAPGSGCHCDKAEGK